MVSPTNLCRATNSFKFTPFIDFKIYSNFTMVCHIMAYCLRFIKNCRIKHDYLKGPLSLKECLESVEQLARLSQLESFPEEIQSMLLERSVNKRSNIIKLFPFLDSQNILRVGGRLKNSDFSFYKKHPIIISGKHAFSRLLFRFEHKRLCHVGPRQLLSYIRERFWSIGGLNLAKKTTYECIVCKIY
jgi:hypothetical protein